jgi:hypothetical protein
MKSKDYLSGWGVASGWCYLHSVVVDEGATGGPQWDYLGCCTRGGKTIVEVVKRGVVYG